MASPDCDLQGDTARSSPNGLINLVDGAVVVENAGEEIMELYMTLATISTSAGGLGFLDSSSSLLEFDLVISDPAYSSTSTASAPSESPGTASRAAVVEGKGRSKRRVPGKLTSVGGPGGTGGTSGKGRDVVVPVKVQQDLNLLKGSTGDTGSVLWRSSLHLARHLLSQHHFPLSPSPLPTHLSHNTAPRPLLDPDKLRSARLLELGAGTGLLATLLSPLCPSGTYVASDRQENLRLLWRNLELNGRVQPLSPSSSTVPLPVSPTRRKATLPGGPGKGGKKVDADTGHSAHAPPGPHRATGSASISGGQQAYNVQVEEVDWMEIAKARKPVPLGEGEAYDLVLAVDCIFNESLCGPLVSALGRYVPVGGKGLALVVVELRSADVLELFLDTWLNDPTGGWTIIRLAEDAMGLWDGQRPRWVGWVGWRS